MLLTVVLGLGAAPATNAAAAGAPAPATVATIGSATAARVPAAPTGAASTGVASTGRAGPPAVARRMPRWADYFAQRPAWRERSCSSDVLRMSQLIAETGTRTVVQCSRVRIPLVWSDLSKGYGYLQISRVRRVKARTDTRPTRLLFVNPGGPGVTADWLAPTVAALEPAVNATHDIVAVDARGTGGSLPVACSTFSDGVRDYHTPTTAEVPRGPVCREAHCLPVRHQGAADLAAPQHVQHHSRSRFRALAPGPQGGRLLWRVCRHMDGGALRRLLPPARRTFRAGLQHPIQRRLADELLHQPRGFQRRFDQQFLPWAARRHKEYGLGRTTTSVRATVNSLRAAAAARRLPGVTPQDLDNLVVGHLYTDVGFGDLAGELADLRRELRAARPAAAGSAAARPGAVAAGTEDTVFMAIQCNDSAWSKKPASYVTEGLRLGKRYPLLGYAWVTSPCAYWPFPPTRVPRNRTAKRAPMLMVQSELDPATPYEGALAAHRARPETRLLSVQDQGNHGVWLGENGCVERTVGTYLTTGKMPARDTVCPGVPLPSDTRVYAVESPLPSTAAAAPRPKATALSASGVSSAERGMRGQDGRIIRDARLDPVRDAARRHLVQGWIANR